MTSLLLDIDFRNAGNSADHLLDGWSGQEAGHRWSQGRESRLTLPAAALDDGSVLVISATPCLHPPALTAQLVMLALDGRLLGTILWRELQVAGLRLPARPRDAGGGVLTLSFLSCGLPRAAGQIRDGTPLALAVHNVRMFRLEAAAAAAPEVPRSPAELAARFESLGQGCQFGLVQRHFGIEPLGLLRFVDTMAALLYEGLFARFAGVEDPGRLELLPMPGHHPPYRWHQRDYGLGYDAEEDAGAQDGATMRAQHARRLDYLRRKLLKDVAAGRKMFVLTRVECLTEPEALAVFCALSLHGPATLLWTIHGDARRAGEVVRLAPGFLRAELGQVNEDRYAGFELWLQIMQAAALI